MKDTSFVRTMRHPTRLGLAAGVFGVGCFAAGYAWADQQQHMENALSTLERALGELEKAEPNKGGHRTRAIERVNDAIHEVILGIESANGAHSG